jgi:hypothetical protein
VPVPGTVVPVGIRYRYKIYIKQDLDLDLAFSDVGSSQKSFGSATLPVGQRCESGNLSCGTVITEENIIKYNCFNLAVKCSQSDKTT